MHSNTFEILKLHQTRSISFQICCQSIIVDMFIDDEAALRDWLVTALEPL